MVQRLKEVRKALGLNQTEFAKHLGITQTAYSMIESGIDISYSSIPQLYNLDGFGVLLGAWITQLGLSSGAYYLMSRSDHKIQLPMAMLNTMPDEIKSRLDMTQVVTTVLNTTDN